MQDEEDPKRLKRSRFIDDIAEVEDDDEDDDEEVRVLKVTA